MVHEVLKVIPSAIITCMLLIADAAIFQQLTFLPLQESWSLVQECLEPLRYP